MNAGDSLVLFPKNKFLSDQIIYSISYNFSLSACTFLVDVTCAGTPIFTEFPR